MSAPLFMQSMPTDRTREHLHVAISNADEQSPSLADIVSLGAMEEPLESGHEPPLAAHLVTERAFYTHHGIYVGQGRVIHYSGHAGGRWRGPVEETSLERFARGHDIRVVHDCHIFDDGEVVARARSRLGERDYHLLTNNCEHFCAWSLRGECRSWQVDRFLRTPRRIMGLLKTWLERSRRPAADDSLPGDAAAAQ